MNRKHIFFISCAFALSGCNGIGVLLNPPTETGYPPPTEKQTVNKSPTDNQPKGTRTVIRKAPD